MEQGANIDPDSMVILKEYNLVSVKAAFSSVRFYQYFGMMILSNMFGGIFSY